jgi:hypothetical protein
MSDTSKPEKEKVLEALEILTTYVKQSEYPTEKLTISETNTEPAKLTPTKSTDDKSKSILPKWSWSNRNNTRKQEKTTTAAPTAKSTTAVKAATAATVATGATAATASTQNGSISKIVTQQGLEFDDRGAGTIATGPNGTPTTVDRIHAVVTDQSNPNRDSGDINKEVQEASNLFSGFFGGKRYKKRKTKRKSKSSRKSRKS